MATYQETAMVPLFLANKLAEKTRNQKLGFYLLKYFIETTLAALFQVQIDYNLPAVREDDAIADQCESWIDYWPLERKARKFKLQDCLRRVQRYKKELRLFLQERVSLSDPMCVPIWSSKQNNCYRMDNNRRSSCYTIIDVDYEWDEYLLSSPETCNKIALILDLDKQHTEIILRQVHESNVHLEFLHSPNTVSIEVSQLLKPLVLGQDKTPYQGGPLVPMVLWKRSNECKPTASIQVQTATESLTYTGLPPSFNQLQSANPITDDRQPNFPSVPYIRDINPIDDDDPRPTCCYSNNSNDILFNGQMPKLTQLWEMNSIDDNRHCYSGSSYHKLQQLNSIND